MILSLAADPPIIPIPPSGGGNNSAVTVAIIMAVASIIGTAIAGWYTFRGARRNAEITREAERSKLANTAWEGWREDVETLRRQRKEDSESYEAHRRECARQIRELTTKVNAQDERLEEMDEKHDRERDEFRHQRMLLEKRVDALVSWGRAVVTIMRAQGVVFPPPPPGVADTDPTGFPTIRRSS